MQSSQNNPAPLTEGELTLKQLLLEWGHSEIKVPRWKERYIFHIGEEAFLRISAMPQVGDLSEEDQKILINGMYRRRGDLLEKYLEPAAHFQRSKLDALLLGELHLLPEMDVIGFPTIYDFAHSKSHNPNEWRDPRNIADKFLLDDPDFEITSSLIIVHGVPFDGPILLEGYARAITFLRRSERTQAPLQAEIPCIVAVHTKPLP